MDTPTTLLEAVRAKYEALRADFGDKAADRLREVLENLLAQVTGGRRATPSRPRGAAGRRPGGRTWTPAQKEEQRRKMAIYWASRKREKGPRAKKGRGAKASAASDAAPQS